ncbi:MAG: TIGR04283 family arsenosugar biosynthesis glycosyltransferase [Bacteroidota bacterium]|nr:TIGR04283 family arsenosugar biosynthesis glycosyltransferase [Bacteroidota bacterium]
MISVIIPTYNEEGYIGATVGAVLRAARKDLLAEVIVVDGGSTDGTTKEAEAAGARVITSLRKGRAVQMNVGAENAQGTILYFLHADSIPPGGFTQRIIDDARETIAGCFRLRFDHRHWFLRANCWFTRFDIQAFRYGDQSLFVKADAFQRTDGFNEQLVIFEDNEIITRLKKIGSFKVLPFCVQTSARKYLENGIYRMQGVFYLMWFMYSLGYSQEKLVNTYRVLIRQDKI